jgi:hypothetical protein
MAAKLQDSDTTAPSGRELYHLHFSLQAASPETFGYTLVASEEHHWLYTNTDYIKFADRQQTVDQRLRNT